MRPQRGRTSVFARFELGGEFLAFGWRSAFGAADTVARMMSGFSRRGAVHGRSAPRQYWIELLHH
jgi:hypothetical protein